MDMLLISDVRGTVLKNGDPMMTYLREQAVQVYIRAAREALDKADTVDARTCFR
jgi:hypothetical protein